MSSETPAADAAPGDGAPASAAPPADECQTIEHWRDARRTHPIWYRSAFVREHWCEGLLITAEQYDQAVHAAEHEVCR